ncbi:hemagglutinin repeat-containing protein [uncultured Haemophilus sp.]|uniref:two-partner secretion domain-containing protein n=1 Tax=uncultured Haemophilus sp. TaxID=237779 RepID=UPI00258A3DE3|nr:hemagglutinin repeat-containing protein [uncultured Haemophilus sp.]
MNKRHYKVIFSRVLNQLVVVSELAKSQGKAQQSENVSAEQEKTGLFSTALSLNPIHFSLMLALGFVFLAPSVHAEDMAIRADKSAPNNQQPTVLQTANGLPQVNIQTPSAGGVSRNQYSQFDVAEKGAILNNARQATQTQMAGWVQGNPNLARGEAKVILNEVNSANPSRLKGYLEVAGKKADVVIANPSGIQCDGCGVINAGRTTLTTGKADVENGELKGYRVRGGKVTVGQKGMDTSKADYTDIIAEKAEIKGGVWAKQVKVTTGKNNVDRTNDSVVYVGDKNTDNTDRTSETQGENQSYSVDVSQLGGMYAEKIHLVDNGQGLGVRNAGHIGASAGSVKIDSQGKIVNEGFIGGSENAELNAKKNIENRGTAYAKAQTQLNAHNIDNKKGVIAGKQVQLNTNNVDNRKQSDKGSLIVASEKVSIKAKNLDNSGTKSNSQNVQGIKTGQLNVVADTVSNQQGAINVSDEGRIKTAQLSNQQGDILSGGKIVVEGDKASTVVDNTGGRLHSDSQLDLTAKTLVNEGNISSRGNANIALKDGLNLKNAFKVDGTLNFSTEGKLTNNVALRIGQAAIIHAAEVENIKNAEISADATQITTERLTNRGLIDGTTTYLDASTLNNLGTGRIYGDHLSIASSELTNDKEGEHSATIAARQRLDFGVGTLVNRDHAFIFSQDKLYIGGGLDDKGYAVGKATFIDNASATIEALGDGAINTHRLWNHDIHLKMGEVISYEGFSLFSLPNSSESYRGGVDGYMNWNNKNRHDNNAYFTFYDQLKGRIGSPNWHAEYFTRKTITPTIEHQDPAKITFGGNLTLQGDGFENYASKFLIGKRLTLGDQIVESNKTNGDIGHAGGVQLRNKDAVANILKFDNGEAQEIGAEKHHCGKRHRCWGHYNHGTTQIYERPLSPVPHYFKVVDNTIGESIASTGSVDAYHKSGNVASIDINANLPTESLYQINPNANSHYLVETDPKFTDRNKWLSSDYMFKQLRNDPQNMLKRLGDGFYEQHLVSEQINQLTGRRFLGNYSSDYDQYKALMDNGAYYAQKMNLVPGVALTSSQMKELTSDMVWMVKREVTLKDGSKKEVLVPQVYVVGRNTDIDSRGAVISANDVIMNIKGDVQNSGVISGRNLTGLAANNIENLGGRLQGRELYLVAKNMLNNLGGELNATDRLVAQGKHINIESTTTETENTPDFYQKSLTQQASVKVGSDNKKGSASFIATENITVKGANVDVNGNAVFSAGKALNFGTVETENKAHYVPNADNYYKLDQKQEVGSQLNVTGNIDAVGKSAVEMRGVSITSNGTINVLSKGNINIQEARDREQLSSASKGKSRGLTSSTTEVYRHKHNYDTAEASNLDADKINLHSNNGNITIQGSNVAAGNGLTVKGKNIDIREAENRVYSDDFYSKKKSGMLGGGIGVTFGSQKQTTESDQIKLYAQSSQVGSLHGNTTMIAKDTYTQTASAVSAIKGDVNILAKKADVKAADDKYETNTKQTFEQKGLTIAITSPIISAIQAVQGAIKSTKQVGDSKHGRVNAMAAANAGFDAYRAADSVMNAGDSIQKAMSNSDVDSVVGVQITYGQQKSESRTHTEGKTVAKSQVNAGGKVNIVATGAGKDSNINIEGSDISGKQGTTLMADNQVNIQASEQNHQERSTNKSSGFNAGVAIKVGSGVAAGITVGGNYGKGYGNGDETSYVASHVGDSQSKTVIQAGGDANIIGSQVKGKRVELNAENLNIESLQDKSSYHGKQMNVSGSVTVGYGFAAGGSFNKSKINADHASVNEQAGIYAGDEGYDINANKHTDLKGALITSTQKAEADGKNHFSTGSITHSDIENHSNYSGSSFGVSGSVSANFETPFGENGAAQSTKQATDKDGNLLYTDKNGNTTVNSKGVNGQENTKKLAEGKESLQFSYGMGYGKDSDSQSSTTKSGINTQNIIIKDEAEQLKRTGKTVQEEIAAIKTDITTESAQSQSGKLENRFNKDDVQKELDFQREVTEKFGPNVAEAGSLLANKFGEEAKAKRHEAAIALEEAEKAKAENNNETNRALVKQARDNFETASREAKEWETGGNQRLIIDSALNVISTALAGRPAAEVVASGLSPAVNNQIKKATTDAKGNVNTALNLTAHALWGAVEAYAGNRNVAAGAAGAAGGEAAAHFLASTLYDKSPEKLSEEEKRTVSSLSQVAAGIAGGSLSDSSDGAIIAAKTAKDSVENNSMADDVHPSDERKQNIEMYAKVLFNGDEDKAKEYQEGLEIAEAKGQIDSVKETADAVVNLDDTVVSLWEAISNPEKTYNNVVVSLKDWDEAYTLALQENPKLAGEMQGYRQGKMKGVSTGGVVLSGTGLALVKPMGALKNGVVDFTKNQVNRVVNHTVLNRVINEVDNIAVSTDKGFINGTKVCGASCEIKATSKAEQALIDDIVKNGDIKGGKTESLIHGLAKRSGYEPLQGGKYGSNNGFDHVLVGKDGSVVIIDSKQIKANGAIQVSSKGAGDTNQLSSKWINVVSGKLSKNDPVRIAIENAELQEKPIKTIIAGVDKSNGKVVLLPVKVPNKH